jgi:hypothetical protein
MVNFHAPAVLPRKNVRVTSCVGGSVGTRRSSEEKVWAAAVNVMPVKDSRLRFRKLWCAYN